MKRNTDLYKLLNSLRLPERDPEELLKIAVLRHKYNRIPDTDYLNSAPEYEKDIYARNDFDPENIKLVLDSSLPDIDIIKGEEKETYQGFLRRICVNYVRHVEIRYDKIIKECGGGESGKQKYYEAKVMILEMIGTKYPWLRNTCMRLKIRAENQRNREKARKQRKIDNFNKRFSLENRFVSGAVESY